MAMLLQSPTPSITKHSTPCADSTARGNTLPPAPPPPDNTGTNICDIVDKRNKIATFS
eukprot:CAMPEP_0172489234 /NCGR_PEP_ID=MMETSP1066-20121228/19108_1 /TAXON_ID=671091 /ORGANISM="Coscinodiscus wailesii, Strain CCMP2513" /LENGTH=57 /DNA_ID=CAMNT_0013256945 /DNA_START=163 /DNA_END=332 /DNA_ORIENTATION=-